MKLETNKLKAAYMAIKLLTHPLTSKVLTKIESNPMNVTDLYKSLKVEQSVCSAILGKMRRANLVTVERIGREQFYSINMSGVQNLVNAGLDIYKDLK